MGTKKLEVLLLTRENYLSKKHIYANNDNEKDNKYKITMKISM